jgi:hypothetical protein
MRSRSLEAFAGISISSAITPYVILNRRFNCFFEFRKFHAFEKPLFREEAEK